MSQPCVLCGSNENDPVIFGALSLQNNHMVHRTCLIMCMGKFVQNKRSSYGHWDFLRRDLMAEKRRFRWVECSYCSRLGANLSCCHVGCTRKFHTKCGVDNLALLQHGGRFDSFCAQHAPEGRRRPGPDDDCVICMDPAVPENGVFSSVFQAPCCRNGWFHRPCMQELAHSADYLFKCPLCRDILTFDEVSLFGVSVPKWRFCLPGPPPFMFTYTYEHLHLAEGRPLGRAAIFDGAGPGPLRRGPRIIHSRPILQRDHAPRPRIPRPYIP